MRADNRTHYEAVVELLANILRAGQLCHRMPEHAHFVLDRLGGGKRDISGPAGIVCGGEQNLRTLKRDLGSAKRAHGLVGLP